MPHCDQHYKHGIGKVQDYRHSRRYAQIGISDEQKRSGKCTTAESGKLNKLFPAVKFISPLLALAGIALISNASFSGSVNVGGVLIALLSGVVYAVYFIAGRESAYASLETPVSNFYITASACLWSLAAALILGRFCLPADSVMWIILFFEAFLGYVVGLRLLLAGIKLLGSVSASALNTLEPAFASLTSMAVFGEAMGLLKGCGVILVLAAAVIGILTLNREDSKTRSKA